jgi:hypothetical protein
MQLIRMGHLLDRRDLLDALEDSAALKRPVIVEFKAGERAVFRAHDRIPVSDIAFCSPATQEPSYAGKS